MNVGDAVASGDCSTAAQDAPEHSCDRELAAGEVVVLGQVVGEVLFAQAVVDVALCGWRTFAAARMMKQDYPG